MELTKAESVVVADMKAVAAPTIKWDTQFAHGFTYERNPPKKHVGVCGARRAYVSPVPGAATVWSVRCGDFSATFASCKEAKAAASAVLRS